ncbi:hypothetical protein C8R46DRAFT_501192 [Mycena filopes]|nr:hypothetical protein C8R46DRAFT_501192 [Mycena filopes]
MPSLPIELQQEIIEIAIRTSRKDRALKLNLSLVAPHIQLWVDRVFYESVTISNSMQVDQFIELVHVKPAGFFATTVKMLDLHPRLTDIQTDRVLGVCSGVQALHCVTIERSESLPPPHHLSSLPLRRLSTDVDLAEILYSAVEPVWCSTLTHLDLSFPWLRSFGREMLRRLPCLTNVALHSWSADRPLADAICNDCPNLRVLVIFVPEEELDTVEYRDAAHVVLVDDTLEEEWDTGLFSSLPDFWIRAENIVAARKLESTPSSVNKQS